MLLEGLHLPVTTPFYPDGRLNLRKLEHNIDRYSRTPAAGITVLSDIGEPEMLSDLETRHALESGILLAAKDKVMLAGVSRPSVIGTLSLAEFAATSGYDAALIKAPIRCTPSTIRLFFQAVADSSSLPVVLYSTGSSRLMPELVAELALHPRIIGLIDEDSTSAHISHLRTATASVQREVIVTSVFAAVTGRMLSPKNSTSSATLVSAEALGGGVAVAVATDPPKATIKTRTKMVGFQIIAANSANMLEDLRSGAVGAMPAFAASAPQAVYEVYAAWKDGDQPLAEIKQSRISAAIEEIERGLGIAGIRYASELTGYFGGRPRLPVLPLSGEERDSVEKIMKGIRN